MDEIILIARNPTDPEEFRFRYRLRQPNCGLVLDDAADEGLRYIGQGFQSSAWQFFYENGSEVPSKVTFALTQATNHWRGYHASRVQHCPLCTKGRAWPELTDEGLIVPK